MSRTIPAVAALGVAIFLAITSLLFLQTPTGYNVVDAQGGYITHLTIIHKQSSAYWQGYYGLALQEPQFNDTQTDVAQPGQVDLFHLVFNCLEPDAEHEIYASTTDPHTLDFSTARAGTVTMVDDYLGLAGDELDSANLTFLNTTYILAGQTNISGVPTLYTYVNGAAGSTRYSTSILNISGKLVFVAKKAAQIGTNFKGTNSNYQLLVAVRNVSTLYYFSQDPNDQCPPGSGTGLISDGFAVGYVTDNATGLPLSNVTIGAGGVTNATNGAGFFNMTVPTGSYHIVGVKSGYTSHVGTINISFQQHTWHNFSLSAVTAQEGPRGAIKGIVRDNITNATLANITVHVGGILDVTNSSGNYSANVTAGTYSVVATGNTFQSYVQNVSINASNTTVHNIYLVPLTGTLTGRATRSDTFAVLSGVTVRAGDQTATTNSTGHYALTLSPGTYVAVATKSSFLSDVGLINITAGRETLLNFSLTPNTGTLIGVVYDNATNNTIAGAQVFVSDKILTASATGNFSTTLATGTHVLWVTQPGYVSHVQNVSIAGLETTGITVRLRPLNGTLAGNATDNSTGERLSNVTISIAGTSRITGGNGTFNLSVPTGTHVFVAIKAGYTSFIDNNVTIEPGLLTAQNISLPVVNITPVVTQAAEKGILTGTVTDDGGQVLANVTIAASGLVNETNSTGGYRFNLTAANHTVVAIKDGYNPYTSTVQVNASNTTVHDIVMNATTPEGLGPGIGPGLGAGLGVGLGVGTGVTRTVTPPVEQKEEGVPRVFAISRIIKVLRQGTFATVPIQMTNYKSAPLSVELAVDGTVAALTSFDETRFSIASGQKAEATLTILANAKPNVYNGTLRLSGDIEEDIPVYVLITEKDKLPIETLQIQLELFENSIHPNAPLRFKVHLQNLLQEAEYPVRLSYQAEHRSSNASFELGQEEVLISTSLALLKDFRLPEDAPLGDYVLVLDAEYLAFSSSFTEPFTILQVFYKYALFGLIPVWMLAATILLMSSGTFGVVTYKRQQAKKKRYHIELDYGALPQEGPRSIKVGKIAESQHSVYFDIDLFQVHTLIAGSSGGGKSVSAKVLIEEALMKGAAAIVFDPTAQWTGFLRKNVDKKMFALYPQYGLKPSDARAFNGNIRQLNNPREFIDIRKYMKPGEITIFAINKLDPKDIDVIVANTVKQVFRANLPESKQLKLMIIFDEVHRLLPKFGGSGQGFLQIERAAREFRKWGVGLMLISQVLTDFMGEIKANINTEIQMRTRDEKDLARVQEAYGSAILQSLVKAAIGTGMMENANYNHGKPFFVSFRPLLHEHAALPNDVLENYNKYNFMVDELEYQIEQLKETGLDIFDIQLELKLAKDKLKSGNFNMVDIYLESIRPRVENEFKKLGKKPKPYKIQLVEEEPGDGKAAAAGKKESGKSEKETAAGNSNGTPEKTEERARSNEAATADGAPQPQTAAATRNGSSNEKTAGSTDKNPDAPTLIANAKQAIENSDKAAAREIYARLAKLYALLGKEEKAKLYPDIAALTRMMPK